mmetsp:Transcript_2854/g.4868  ORF Transcript_2854/g.4868 Transcript_2854/m.4868 type:complete len:142 (-) Transcript_2854:525-950(-)
MHYEQIIKDHDMDIMTMNQVQCTFGEQISRWDASSVEMNRKERKASVIEKRLDRDMNDLVEYTKWINQESQKLRERVRKSERVINDLRSSGEESVESLMETLYMLKIKQEELEMEAQQLRSLITTKEQVIKQKEEEKGDIK